MDITEIIKNALLDELIEKEVRELKLKLLSENLAYLKRMEEVNKITIITKLDLSEIQIDLSLKILYNMQLINKLNNLFNL